MGAVKCKKSNTSNSELLRGGGSHLFLCEVGTTMSHTLHYA